jgi:predicted XRE-type DNA-binding protein
MLNLPKETPPMSADLASKAITLVRVLKLKQHQAAAVLGVNQGRISEVLNGKTFVGVTPCSTDQLSFDL